MSIVGHMIYVLYIRIIYKYMYILLVGYDLHSEIKC